MSRKNNVNKDHYTVLGRDRQGENLILETEAKAHDEEPRRNAGRSTPSFIPGAPPGSVSERPGEQRGTTAESSAGKTGVRSGAKKQATANRGGKAPAATRPVAGAYGRGDRKTPKSAGPLRGASKTKATGSSRSPARSRRGSRNRAA